MEPFSHQGPDGEMYVFTNFLIPIIRQEALHIPKVSSWLSFSCTPNFVEAL